MSWRSFRRDRERAVFHVGFGADPFGREPADRVLLDVAVAANHFRKPGETRERSNPVGAKAGDVSRDRRLIVGNRARRVVLL